MATPAEEIGSAYRRALRLSRERGFQLTRGGLERIFLALAEVINRLAAEEATGIITPERADALRRETEGLLRGIRRELLRVTEATVAGTLVDVVEIHRRVTLELFRRYGPRGIQVSQVLGGFDQLPVRALAALASRPNAATFRTLINRRIAALAPEIDTFLEAAVARGVSVGRASKDLAAIMARDEPQLLRLLDRPEIFDSAVHRGAGTIEWGAYGIDETEVSAVRGLLYDARRILVTEGNGAHREANAAAMSESPVVIAAKWQLSGRHFRADACDVLAQTDAYGFGPGWYPPDRWPVHPHPHCGCYAGRTRFRRPAEWAAPKPASPGLGIDPGQDAFTERWAAEWTEAERQRNQVAFAAAVRFGDRARIAA